MFESRPAFLIPHFYVTGALSSLSICVALYVLVTLLFTKIVVNQKLRGVMIIGLLCNIFQQSIAIYVYGVNAILRLRTLILLTVLIYIAVQIYLTIMIFRSEDKLILGCLPH
jgi:hypothetical protein